MFSRISAALQSAVDTIVPPVPLLHDFVYHWRQLMKFYDNSSDALNVPIESTHLPIHLDQMLKALQEEQEDIARKGADAETGQCLEYLLQHRVPDLLASLACADTPSGMRHLGLVSFSRLISLASDHLISQAALYEPIQRMVRLCGQVTASPTESQEVRLLCVLAAMIGRKPELASQFCITQKSNSPLKSSSSSDSPTPNADVKQKSKDSLLTEALLRYIDSADGRVRVKACEALLVLATLASTSVNLAEESTMAESLSMRLAALHRALPLSVEPADLEELPQPSWGMDNPLELREQFPGCRQVASFLSWLDFCDKVAGEGQAELSALLVSRIQENLLIRELTPKIKAGVVLACSAEPLDEEGMKQARACSITLALVARLLRQSHSTPLREGLSTWLVGQQHTENSLETVRDALLCLVENAHGDMALETMRLMEVLVDEPYGSALNNLIFTHLEGHKAIESPALPELNNGKYPQSQTLAPNNIHLILEGFLQLLPPFLRSAETEAGYESYLQDAQRQYEGVWQRCRGMGCPIEVPTSTGADDDCCSSDSRPEADHVDKNVADALLPLLLARLEQFPEQEYEVNLQLTALLSRLALLPHALLHEILLSPAPPPTQGSFSLPAGNQVTLGAALRRLANRLAQEAPTVNELQKRLRCTRQKLLGDPATSPDETDLSDMEQEGLLESVVVLEEFCKELAAIAFVKYHLHSPT